MGSTPHNPGIILSITQTDRWRFHCAFVVFLGAM
jgi:hypothetical protein